MIGNFAAHLGAREVGLLRYCAAGTVVGLVFARSKYKMCDPAPTILWAFFVGIVAWPFFCLVTGSALIAIAAISAWRFCISVKNFIRDLQEKDVYAGALCRRKHRGISSFFNP